MTSIVDIRPLWRPIYLREFAPEYEEETLLALVNPTRAKIREYGEIVRDLGKAEEELAKLREAAEKKEPVDEKEIARVVDSIEAWNDRYYRWFAGVWKKGESTLTEEDLVAFKQAARDGDPALWTFLTARTWELIHEHRANLKKA